MSSSPSPKAPPGGDHSALLEANAAFRAALIAACRAAPAGSAVTRFAGDGLALTGAIAVALGGEPEIVRDIVPSASGAPVTGEALAEAAEAAIASCDGDLRATVEAMVVACGFLEAEVERLSASISPGFVRGRVSPRQR